MQATNIRRWITAFALGAMAASSHAHSGHDASGFTAGLVHPFTGLDHLLAMLAVGIWAASMRRPTAWALPSAFPLLMCAGASAALAGWELPLVEPAVAASVLVLGLAVASAWQAPQALAVPLVATFGIFHGFAHGTELPAEAGVIGYASGFVLATVALHATGVVLGRVRVLPHGAALLRAGGWAMTVAGAWLLAGVSGIA